MASRILAMYDTTFLPSIYFPSCIKKPICCFCIKYDWIWFSGCHNSTSAGIAFMFIPFRSLLIRFVLCLRSVYTYCNDFPCQQHKKQRWKKIRLNELLGHDIWLWFSIHSQLMCFDIRKQSRTPVKCCFVTDCGSRCVGVEAMNGSFICVGHRTAHIQELFENAVCAHTCSYFIQSDEFVDLERMICYSFNLILFLWSISIFERHTCRFFFCSLKIFIRCSEEIQLNRTPLWNDVLYLNDMQYSIITWKSSVCRFALPLPI